MERVLRSTVCVTVRTPAIQAAARSTRAEDRVELAVVLDEVAKGVDPLMWIPHGDRVDPWASIWLDSSACAACIVVEARGWTVKLKAAAGAVVRASG